MAKNITLRNNTATNTGKGAQMTHSEMDANLETFFMSSSLDGTTLYLHSTGSANVDAIDLSGLGGAGAQGIQGIQGSAGVGTQGIQGLVGTGVQGIQGTDGAGTQGIQGLVGTGVQGTDGTQGVQGLAGGAASQGIQGTQGLIGIQGTDGAGTQGIQGLIGTQGTQGLIGTQGTQGIQGSIGTQGTDGTQGTQGIQGVKSAQGIQGIQGTQGTQGIQGIQGLTGTNGSTSGRIYYFNQSLISTAGYSELGTQPTTSAETNTAVLSTANGDTKIKDFISDSFDFTVIPGGVQRFFLWMTKDNQNDHIETYVVLKITDNSGNVLATAGTSQAVDVTWNNNNTTPSLVNVDITFPTTSVAIGQRMLVEVWSRNNENQDSTTTLYTEGASHYSYVITSVGATSGVTGAQGTQGIQGIQGTDGIAESDFYHLPNLATGGIQGINVLGKVVAGSTEIATNNSTVTVSIGEIANLTLGEQVHITATGWGPRSVALNVTVQDPSGASALPMVLNQSGDIQFRLNQPVDAGSVYIMYHVWYTTTTFPT